MANNKSMPGAYQMRKLGAFLKKKLPGGWGFALIVFPFETPGIGNYISNAERASMITSLRETANRLEKREDFDTPEEN